MDFVRMYKRHNVGKRPCKAVGTSNAVRGSVEAGACPAEAAVAATYDGCLSLRSCRPRLRKPELRAGLGERSIGRRGTPICRISAFFTSSTVGRAFSCPAGADTEVECRRAEAKRLRTEHTIWSLPSLLCVRACACGLTLAVPAVFPERNVRRVPPSRDTLPFLVRLSIVTALPPPSLATRAADLAALPREALGLNSFAVFLRAFALLFVALHTLDVAEPDFCSRCSTCSLVQFLRPSTE